MNLKLSDFFTVVLFPLD